MSTHSLTVRRTVHAPVEQVWAVLTDLDHAEERLTNVTGVRVLTDGPYAVGTRWRETRKMLGVETTEEMWVAENDPLRSTVIEASSGGTDYRTVFTLKPLGERSTELTMQFSGENGDAPTGVRKALGKAMGSLGLRLTRRTIERDLDDIAAAAATPV
ncbi:SRPBCC family protein [Ornithinimicrobium sediminis]|uniref:SRPBCC family protein n=1 Tax=Ornithinimicrobium sediminis TaxID=2904603 RepID=UPI001E64E52A|nr:SRPBCC family protein [Ornithinimicrobium sediminis]